MPDSEQDASTDQQGEGEVALEDLPIPETPTTKSAWKSPRKEGFMVTLPSGNAARLRRTLDLITLMKVGKIPNPLMAIVNDMITGKRKTITPKDLPEGQMIELLKLVDQCIPGIFLEPKVATPPKDLDPAEAANWEPEGDDTIALSDLEQNDRMFAFAFAQGGPRELSRFRQGPDDDVEGLPDVPELPSVTIATDGPE